MNEMFETVINIMDSDNDTPRKFLVQYEIIKSEEWEDEESIDIEETEDEEETNFIPNASITIRELSDEEADLLDLDDETVDTSEFGTPVCGLYGWLIRHALMNHYGYNTHLVCDEFSQDLEYCWAVLTDPDISAVQDMDGIRNLFYVDAINIEPEYDTDEKRNGIITALLAKVIQIVNDMLDANVDDDVQVNFKRDAYRIEDDYYIDLIAYYPEALPYDNSAMQKQTDIACALVGAIDKANDEQAEMEITVAPEIYARTAGIRVSDDNYPESAKNRMEWDLLEGAGWYECSNSRLLYKTSGDE